MTVFSDALTALAPDIWWPLVSDASDAVGSVDGTATNVPVFGGANGNLPTFGEPGIGGSAGSVRFDGSRASRIEGTLAASHATFSSVMLVRFHGWAPENAAFGDHISSLLQIDAESNWMLRVRGDGTPANNVTEGDATGGSVTSTPPTIDTLDQTYLVTMTWDGSTRRLYLDCDEIGSSSGSGPVNSGTIRLNWEFGDDRCSDVWYSDVAFFYRALTPTEVCDLADTVGELPPPVPIDAPAPVPAAAGSRFRTVSVRATGPQGLAYLDTLGGTSPPVIRRELGGNSEAEWTWYAPAGIDPTAAAIGNPVELLTSPGNSFRGVLNQPGRGTDGWDMHADGVDRLADRYTAVADAGHDDAAAHPDEVIDNAIAAGLNWTRLDTLPAGPKPIPSGSLQLGAYLDELANDLGYYWWLDDFGAVHLAAAPTDVTYLLLASSAPPPTLNDYITSYVVTYLDDGTLNVTTLTVTNTAAPARFWNQQPLDLSDSGFMTAAHATAAATGRLAKQQPRASYTEPFVVVYGELLTPGGVAVDLATVRPGCLVRPMIVDPGRSAAHVMGVPTTVFVAKTEWDGQALALSPIDLVDTSFRAVARKVLTGR